MKRNKKNSDPYEIAKKMLEQMSKDIMIDPNSNSMTVKEYLGASLIEKK